jgi:hypothetical protein
MPRSRPVLGVIINGLGGVFSLFVGMRKRPVRIDAELPTGDIVLVVEADAAGVKLVQVGEPRVRVRGEAVRPEEVRFRLVEEDGRLKGILHVEAADVTVEAPFNALGVVADSSSVRAYATARPLRYLSIRADASGVTAEAALAPGGGVYISADSSAVKAQLKPAGEGEYWAEVEADASGVKLAFEGEKAYIVEERSASASRVAIAHTGEEAPVKVKVRVRADASTVKLL